MGILPVAIDDPKGNILIRWARGEDQEACIVVPRFFHNSIAGGLRLVNQVWIENIELEEAHSTREIK